MKQSKSIELTRYYVVADDHPADYFCYYLDFNPNQPPSEAQLKQILSILNVTNFNIQTTTHLSLPEILHQQQHFTEIGPQIEMVTPWCSHVLTVLTKADIPQNMMRRIERSFLYLNPEAAKANYDPMTQSLYDQTLKTFTTSRIKETTQLVDLSQLEEYNEREGLGFDPFDMVMYRKIWEFDNSSPGSQRQPTDVELADLAQSNSEHSRHWLFRGQLELNGKHLPDSLFDLIKRPLRANPNNSLIAMKDNSSAIQSTFPIDYFSPESHRYPRYHVECELLHPIFTAETHNFPTGIAPFPGAATGTGGRIRDIQAVGRGGLMIAGTAGYCIGNLNLDRSNQTNNTHQNLNIPDHHSSLYPWEDPSYTYPLHDPSHILIEASNGASDYGNKIGEPLIQGFTRSFGMTFPINAGRSRRIEWVKPIMFSGGVGHMMDEHLEKEDPELGYLIVRLGGPAYRIGVGGGAASSRSQGDSSQDNKQAQFDRNAVQRDDPEMENKLNKVLRTLIEMGEANPIRSIHDQGAGGMGNVTKEIVSPKGAIVSLGNVHCGDQTLSAKEKWIAEYQEQDTILIHPRDSDLVKEVCLRENLPVQFVGVVTESGRIQVYDPDGVPKNRSTENKSNEQKIAEMFPVDLDLNQVLEEVPPKTFQMSDQNANQVDVSRSNNPLSPENELYSIENYVQKIFRLVSVGSKRFLTNKVDRSVGGLIAQQQCVGPFQTPLSNVAVVAQTFFNDHEPKQGIATAIGEQSIKMQLDPVRGARMTVGEMLTNLVWAQINPFTNIKCSGNWMWEKRHPEEVYALYQAVNSVSDLLTQLGIAIDGGKDSLSMSAQVNQERVYSPRTLVMSAYVDCLDITQIVTPDLKQAGHVLLYLDLANGQSRLGGSAFAQIHNTLGFQGNQGECPDLVDANALKKTFIYLQTLIQDPHQIIYAGHDRSDGGLITTLLEMAIAGNLGFQLNLSCLSANTEEELIAALFAEELGIVIEVSQDNFFNILQHCRQILGIEAHILGMVTEEPVCDIRWRKRTIFRQDLNVIRAWWEETSTNLELKQCDPGCAQAELSYLYAGKPPIYHLTNNLKDLIKETTSFFQQQKQEDPRNNPRTHQVAILREEGSNGDREMAAAFYQAGFSVFDLTTHDLEQQIEQNPEQFSLNAFRGLVFVGGFSFADVLGAGRAWSQTLTSHPEIKKELDWFYYREDTFSLGVCNGCQLMSELGWIPGKFLPNTSGRFESRWATVKVLPDTKAIMLQDMQEMTLGIWVAHREGRYQYDTQEEGEILSNAQRCLAYVNSDRQATEDYPENPNGSEEGLTAICSADGRHLAMMPHPERSIYSWQTPWIPADIKGKLVRSDYEDYFPWLEMFRNTYRWCHDRK